MTRSCRCDGQDVKPWVADITQDLRPAGGGNSLLYLGLYKGQDPNPQQPPGFIMMQANLVMYYLPPSEGAT